MTAAWHECPRCAGQMLQLVGEGRRRACAGCRGEWPDVGEPADPPAPVVPATGCATYGCTRPMAALATGRYCRRCQKSRWDREHRVRACDLCGAPCDRKYQRCVKCAALSRRVA